MDLASLLNAIPILGPYMPWIALAGGVNALVVAPSLAPPASPGGVYAFAYRVSNLLAGNFGRAKNKETTP